MRGVRKEEGGYEKEMDGKEDVVKDIYCGDGGKRGECGRNVRREWGCR